MTVAGALELAEARAAGAEMPPEHREMLTVLAAEVRRLQRMLAECYRLTGADPDGDEDWRLAEHAVQEVRELRQEQDRLRAEQKPAYLKSCPWCHLDLRALSDTRQIDHLIACGDAYREAEQKGGPCQTCWRAHPRYGSSDDVLYCGLVSQETGVPLPCSYFKFGCWAWEKKGVQDV